MPPRVRWWPRVVLLGSVGLVGLGLAAAPAPSWAGPTPAPSGSASATTARRAKAKFEEGLALSDETKWSEALDAFRESDELVASATVRFNIAVTLRALGHYVEAKKMSQGILDDDTSKVRPIKPKLRADVQQLETEVAAKVALVDLEITPKDAEVQVDDAALALNAEGRLEIDPGRHVFIVKADGFQTTSVTQEIVPGEQSLVLLAPPLPKAKPAPGTGPNGQPAEEETPWYEGGVFWGITAGVVAAGAAAVILVVVLQPSAQEPASPPQSTLGYEIPAAFRVRF